MTRTFLGTVWLAVFASCAFGQLPVEQPAETLWSITIDAGISENFLRGDMGPNFLAAWWHSPYPDSVRYYGGGAAVQRKGGVSKAQSVFVPSIVPFSTAEENAIGIHFARKLPDGYVARLGVEFRKGTASGSVITGQYVFNMGDSIVVPYSSTQYARIDYYQITIEPSIRTYLFSSPLFIELGVPVSALIESSAYGFQELSSGFSFASEAAEMEVVYRPHVKLGGATLWACMHAVIGFRVPLSDHLGLDASFGANLFSLGGNFYAGESMREQNGVDLRLGLAYLW